VYAVFSSEIPSSYLPAAIESMPFLKCERASVRASAKAGVLRKRTTAKTSAVSSAARIERSRPVLERNVADIVGPGE
jgi:hypothetical protein